MMDDITAVQSQETAAVQVMPPILPVIAQQLRDYQLQAVDQTCTWLKIHQGNPLITAPTGCGKSHIIAALILQLRAHPEILGLSAPPRCLVLAHRELLVRQNHDKIASVAADLDIGLCAASLDRHDTDSEVIYGTVQSVASMLSRTPCCFGEIGVLIVDEAHHVPPREQSDSTYLSVIDALRKVNPDLRIIGLTATPWRMDVDGDLIVGQDQIFTEISCDLNYRLGELIAGGYLVAQRIVERHELEHQGSFRVLGLETLNITAGDYNLRQVTSCLREGDFALEALKVILANRVFAPCRQVLVFVPGIELAEFCTGWLNEQLGAGGAVCVHSRQRVATGEKYLQQFKDGKVRFLVGADKFLEGFDVPGIDLLVLLRPTASLSLHLQMLGRGMRPAPCKEICLVMDFSGNVEKFGLAQDAIRERMEKQKEQQHGDGKGSGCGPRQLNVKPCPFCCAILAWNVRICPYCHEFVINRAQLIFGAGLGKSVRAGVRRWELRSAWGCEQLQALYSLCYPREAQAWHRQIYETIVDLPRWWRQHAIDATLPPPATADEAVARWQAGELRTPLEILFRRQRNPETIIENMTFVPLEHGAELLTLTACGQVQA